MRLDRPEAASLHQCGDNTSVGGCPTSYRTSAHHRRLVSQVLARFWDVRGRPRSSSRDAACLASTSFHHGDTDGAIKALPSENAIIVYGGDHTETKHFSHQRDAFELQAQAFLTSLDGPNLCRNTPDDTMGDVRVVEAIAASAREKRVVWL